MDAGNSKHDWIFTEQPTSPLLSIFKRLVLIVPFALQKKNIFLVKISLPAGDGKQLTIVETGKQMESSSKIYGDGTEECQSSESGWTMYIGSSMDDDDDDDGGGGGDAGGVYDGGGGGGRKKGTVKDEDEDTDDSMASDASSGPSHLHLQQPWEVQQDKSVSQEKYKCLSKKNKKTSSGKKKGGYEESRKKDESLVNEKRGLIITTVQSGNRGWFGKRK
ncbi:hypothetical protein L1987_66627 [Smallanthus sonchifolius]|uniref:Uncharacterized protein n=1 Tax=Smallanthus sonchifolius TaxID=185202 RepID=A0ACB9BXT6_9ASTR|nr:hypothetical protein L1987_66627 [Smallanthus sonchifolius]